MNDLINAKTSSYSFRASLIFYGDISDDVITNTAVFTSVTDGLAGGVTQYHLYTNERFINKLRTSEAIIYIKKCFKIPLDIEDICYWDIG